MLSETLTMISAIIYEYWAVMLIIIPLYGYIHKFDRDYFRECMKDFWQTDTSKKHICFYLCAPGVFIIYGYKTVLDHFLIRMFSQRV
jgi:hypothetical protein